MHNIDKETILNFIIFFIIMTSLTIALRFCVTTVDKSFSHSRDIEYCIGVVENGNKYTAKVEIKDEKWKNLTKEQRNEIVDECLDTADLPQGGSKKFKIIGIDKTTNKRIFTYDSTTQNVYFYEM